MITQVIIIVFLFLFIFKYKQKEKNLPPGPRNWAVIGSMIQLGLANAKYPHEAMDKLSKKYGEIMSLGLGVHSAVVISSYEAMKEVLSKDEALGRYVFSFVPDRSLPDSHGIIWGNGLMWSKLRKYTVTSLRDFGFGKKNCIESILQEEVRHLIAKIEQKSSENGGIYNVKSEDFAASAINILWNFVGGYRFDEDDPNFKKMLSHNAKQMNIARPSNPYTVFPFLRQWFPKWVECDKHLAAHKDLQNFMKELIKVAQDKRALREGHSEPICFIDLFVDEIERESKNPNSSFTYDQLILILMDLFFGGTETTGTLFNWALLFLVLNPQVQRRVQDEIESIVPSDEEISLEYISRMPYTKAVIYEVMRAANFAPVPPGRVATKDFYYKNYKIPEGTLLLWNTTSVLKDKKFWGDPEVFRPERFLNPCETELIKEYTDRVKIFGFGKRLCIGEALVWNEISIYLTNFMRNFNLETDFDNKPALDNPLYANVVIPRPYSIQFLRRK